MYDHLKSRGQLEKTIFMVWSDHGEAFFEHGRITHNGFPYQEEAAFLWFLRFPDGAMEGESIFFDPWVSHVDILPTLLGLLGIEVELPRGQGFNLVPYLRGTHFPSDFSTPKPLAREEAGNRLGKGSPRSMGASS